MARGATHPLTEHTFGFVARSRVAGISHISVAARRSDPSDILPMAMYRRLGRAGILPLARVYRWVGDFDDRRLGADLRAAEVCFGASFSLSTLAGAPPVDRTDGLAVARAWAARGGMVTDGALRTSRAHEGWRASANRRGLARPSPIL